MATSEVLTYVALVALSAGTVAYVAWPLFSDGRGRLGSAAPPRSPLQYVETPAGERQGDEGGPHA